MPADPNVPSACGAANPWITRSSTPKYDNPWIHVVEHQVINPRGGPAIYGTVHFKNLATGVVPLEPDGATYLVGQFRYALACYSWEIPEGGGQRGRDPVEAARRELLEETGLVAVHWQKLLELHLSNSVTDEHAFAYLAWGLEQHEARPEEAELLEVRRLPFSRVLAMVLSGEITDAITVASILKVQVLAMRGRLPNGLGEAVLKSG